MSAEIRSSSRGRTLVLSLHNPEFRNALDPAMYAAGVEAFNAAGDNPDVRSVVLTGSGNTFCAGGNLGRLKRARQQPIEEQAEVLDALNLWMEAIHTFPKPVIAAVEGAAAGAGLSLVLACDLVVAASDAVFALSHGQVGLSPDGGASWQLGRTLPRQLAHEIVLLGDRVTAQRLHEAGIVNRLVSPGSALEQALALAETLNQRAPNAVASGKELLATAAGSSLAQQLSAERQHFLRNLVHANAGIGIDAFLAKQAPQFE